MKILYLVHQFYPDYYTGTEKFLLNLAKSCQRLGHQVKVVAYSFREDSFFDGHLGDVLTKEDIYQQVPVLYLKHKDRPEDLSYGLGDMQLSKAARRIINAENPDLVHAAHTMRVAEFVKAAKQANIPYVLTLTDFFLICPKANLMTTVNSLCAGPEGGEACRKFCSEIPPGMIEPRLAQANELLQGASRVTAPSKFLSRMCQKEHSSVRIKHFRHGVSYSSIRKNTKTYRSGDQLTFFYGGSLTRHKGVHILANAFRRVKGDVKLKIYGAGDYEPIIKIQAGNDSRIEFCGVFTTEQLSGILSQIDAIVVPSIWYENAPIMILEALASDVPAIVTDLGGMAEAIKDGINGRTFRIGDAEHLSEILQEIVDDPTILNRYKENIRKQFIPSVEQEGLAYQREYQAICQSNQHSRQVPGQRPPLA